MPSLNLKHHSAIILHLTHPSLQYHSVIQARGCVKNYHWGKVDADSYVAVFERANQQDSNKSSKTNGTNANGIVKVPKAELWFGSHPSGPATLILGDDHIRLNDFLAKKPEMVGVVGHYFKYNKQLPFLFKILSVAEPLSLQAHPDIKLASVLHQKDPKNYPDANHKPELAIALTEFEVLCDFRSHREILSFMGAIPMFQKVVGKNNYEVYLKSIEKNLPSDKQRAALGACFRSLMTQEKDKIASEIKSFLLDPQYCTVIDKALFKLIVKLYKLYPGDPGVFAPLFLNYLKLQPGQAVYLKANKLHAYIEGECIECMACSDNVVRAGLTTKFRDVETLINMLDYEPVDNAHDILLQPTKHRDDLMVESFAPTDEFKVDKIVVECKENLPDGDYVLPAKLSGSFFIVLSGKATTTDFLDVRLMHKLSRGSAGFIPPKIAIKLHDIKVPLTIYRAYC